MRCVLRALLIAACCASVSEAQDRTTTERPALDRQPPIERDGSVPREIVRDVVNLWNGPGVHRARGDLTIPAGDTIRSAVAVLEGQLRIAGVVIGPIVAINADVLLEPGAVVRGAITVVGGVLEQDAARVTVMGDMRVWRARAHVKEAADSLAIDDRDLFARFRRHFGDPDGPRSDILLTTAHTYNRTEGLPLIVGPRLRAQNGDTRVSAEILGIFRTSDALSFERRNLGHRASFEIREGRRAGLAIGAEVFDVVDAVEAWQLRAGEVGFASYLFTRDYRDYWNRHGGLGYVALTPKAGAEIRASYGRERWSSRQAYNVPSVIDHDVPWRINPQMDEGIVNMLHVGADLDSRNDREAPKSGWLLHGDYERGVGTLDVVAQTTPAIRSQPTGVITYSRFFTDFRRYNRLGPGAQLNLRVVAGGLITGDPLPLQRRFSVSGVDALPGFDFRRVRGDADVGTCATGSDEAYAALGRPAQCERMVLLQGEWKGDFRVDLLGGRDRFGSRRYALNRLAFDGSWVIFANSGRGWLLGDRGALGSGTGRLPTIGTWRTDLGGGLDFGSVGVYVAQSVSESGMHPNVFVRLGRRF